MFSPARSLGYLDAPWTPASVITGEIREDYLAAKSNFFKVAGLCAQETMGKDARDLEHRLIA